MSRAPTRNTARHQITALLQAWGSGDETALQALTPLVEPHLRRVARRYMRRERAGQTLQPTALVNEAYLRLADLGHVHLRDRAHFFALSARLMRRILVDLARAKGNQKRGGDVRRVSFDERLVVSTKTGQECLVPCRWTPLWRRSEPRLSCRVHVWSLIATGSRWLSGRATAGTHLSNSATCKPAFARTRGDSPDTSCVMDG